MIKTVCTLNDLRKLEVINLCNGKRMGVVDDVEFDLCSGCICSILVPKKAEWGEIFRKEFKRCYNIPWCQIERIGDDTILVRYDKEQV